MKAIQYAYHRNAAITTTPMRSILLLAGAAVIANSPIMGATVVDVPGNARNSPDAAQNLNVLVGAGNSGKLLGNFWVNWNAPTGSFSVPVDTNGFTLNLDTQGGNYGHVASGPISGSGSVIITNGPYSNGFWNSVYTLSGTTANTYTGSTQLIQGQLKLNKTAGVDALLGVITIGSAGQTARMFWGANNQINDLASVTVLLPSVSGTGDAYLNFLDMAGFSDTIGSLVLGDGGTKTQVRTGTGGVLTVGNLTVNGSPMAAGTYTSADGFVTGSGSVVVIPETSSLLLSSLGLIALLRRRR